MNERPIFNAVTVTARALGSHRIPGVHVDQEVRGEQRRARLIDELLRAQLEIGERAAAKTIIRVLAAAPRRPARFAR